jgi:hypothetical protein
MKHHTIQIATALALLASSAVHAQQAVQWKVADGGNGHWYAVLVQPSALGWHEARQAAMAMGADLATVASSEEWQIVRGVASSPAAINQGHGPWLGGFQDASAPDYSEPAGGWRWVDGTSFSFSSWLENEPSNSCQGTPENYLHVHGTPPVVYWNDIGESSTCPAPPVVAAVLEFSSDCNHDGIVDYGQCHDGTLPDYNGNNIPDCCERGEACIAGSYPVQWRTADGGNGHWYWAVADNASFDSQQSMATARGAMVVCVADAEENAFVYRFSRARGLPAIWIGMVQDPWGSEPDGGWRWIDGSGSSWRNWGVGEPNNWQYDEDNCVMIVTPAPIDEAYWPSRWQDYPGFWQIGAIIEWSADCNNDGIVDYGQILQGQLADTNTDGIPDVCQCATNPSLPTCCPGDLDHDATVGGADIGLLLSNWGPCGTACLYDLNNDSKVNGGDLGLLLAGWGPCSN